MEDLSEIQFEEIYNEIVEHVNEYSVEDDIDITIDLEEVKQEIIEVGKTHRPIRLCDYEYGLSTNLKKDHLLIVKEVNENSKAREYFKDRDGEWRCCNHNSKTIKCESLCLKFKYGILFVPIWHSIGCEAVELLLVKQIQDLLTQRDAMETQRILESRKIIVSPNKFALSSPDESNDKSMTHLSERENLYNEILEHVNEYVMDDHIVSFSNDKKAKLEILKLLETHRPIKLCDYEYGLSRNLKKDHRIIIKEADDKLKVREYYNVKRAFWRCPHSNSMTTCNAMLSRIKYGILFAPILHIAECKPRDLLMVMQVQELLKEGNISEAYGFHNRKRNGAKPSKRNSSIKVRKKFALPAAEEREEIDVITLSESEDDNNSPSCLKEAERLYTELLEHVKEYSAENDFDVAYHLEKAKPEIIELLKTHRPIKRCDLKYELSQTLKNHYRYVIRDLDDGSKARVFFKDHEEWRCFSWSSKMRRCKAMRLEFKYGLTFAPVVHSDGCLTRDYSLVRKVQKSVKKEKALKVRDILKNKKESSKQTLSPSSSNTLPANECSSNILVQEREINFHNLVTSSTATLNPYICELVKIYAAILEHINEYSAENNIDLTHYTAKYEIFKLLATHRPRKLCDYEYGLSEALEENHRLIIKEEDDKTKVREYYKIKSYWRCLSNNKCVGKNLKFFFGILFAPISHKCETKEYSFVMQVQKLLNRGKSKEALVLVKDQSIRNRIFPTATSTNETVDRSIMHPSAAKSHALMKLQTERKRTLPTAEHNKCTITPDEMRSSLKRLHILHPTPTETSYDIPMHAQLPFTQTEQSNDSLNLRNQGAQPSNAQNLPNSALNECTISTTDKTADCSIQEQSSILLSLPNDATMQSPLPYTQTDSNPQSNFLLECLNEDSSQIIQILNDRNLTNTSPNFQTQHFQQLNSNMPSQLIYPYTLSPQHSVLSDNGLLENTNVADISYNEFDNLYSDLAKDVNEYSMEKDIDITINQEVVKLEIIELLKTYRPIKFCDYEYGLSTNSTAGHRFIIIIRESENKSRVRQYYKDAGNTWQCSNYNSANRKCESMSLTFKYGILFAPVLHNIWCETTEYSVVMEMQEFLKKKRYDKASGR